MAFQRAYRELHSPKTKHLRKSFLFPLGWFLLRRTNQLRIAKNQVLTVQCIPWCKGLEESIPKEIEKSSRNVTVSETSSAIQNTNDEDEPHTGVWLRSSKMKAGWIDRWTIDLSWRYASALVRPLRMRKTLDSESDLEPVTSARFPSEQYSVTCMPGGITEYKASMFGWWSSWCSSK